MNVDPNWFDGFFEADYLDEFGAVACGHGRHSLELARRGFRVTGVDLSPRSLELAREAAKRESLDVGSFLVDTINLLGFESRFRPNWEELKSGTLLLEQHEYDLRSARGLKRKKSHHAAVV